MIFYIIFRKILKGIVLWFGSIYFLKINPNIVVVMAGGLGDQMCRYALSLAIQELVCLPVSFELSFYKKGKDDFGIEDRKFLLNKIFPLVKINYASKLRIACYRNSTPHAQFECLLKKQPVYIDNINSYYNLFKNQIKTDCFLFDLGLNEKNKMILKHIKSTKYAVALHIRRGDILIYEQKGIKYSLSIIEYILNSIDYIAKKTFPESIVIFVFSNDINWCKENIQCQHEIVFVDNAGDLGPAEDMFLMTQCRHFILSKSTFGYWGASLSDSVDKIILLPSENDRCVPEEYEYKKIYGNSGDARG